MPKKNPNKTPKSKIKQALRQLWLRSRERASALKREKYCCERCGVKQSMAKGKEQKIVVHHKTMIDWEDIHKYVYERLLVTPSDLTVLCPFCHDKRHYALTAAAKMKEKYGLTQSIEEIIEKWEEYSDSLAAEWIIPTDRQVAKVFKGDEDE